LKERYRLSHGEFGEVPGANSFLTSLGPPSDWRAAIATGGWRPSAELKLRTAGIDAGEIPAAFAEDGPSRESIVGAAIERASVRYKQVAFEKIVLVGDAVWDVHTAKRLDLPFVGVGRDDRAARLCDFGAGCVLVDFIDHQNCLYSLEEAVVPRHRDG
jgi:phosphoglycolate phosphatase-like HAD superfamily hydrolase